MTPERLSELRALCDAATGIQWHPNPVPALERYGVTTENEDGTMRALVMLNPNFPHNHEHDAAFIAASRQALPDALDEIERLTAEVEERDILLKAFMNGVTRIARLKGIARHATDEEFVDIFAPICSRAIKVMRGKP